MGRDRSVSSAQQAQQRATRHCASTGSQPCLGLPAPASAMGSSQGALPCRRYPWVVSLRANDGRGDWHFCMGEGGGLRLLAPAQPGRSCPARTNPVSCCPALSSLLSAPALRLTAGVLIQDSIVMVRDCGWGCDWGGSECAQSACCAPSPPAGPGLTAALPALHALPQPSPLRHLGHCRRRRLVCGTPSRGRTCLMRTTIRW